MSSEPYKTSRPEWPVARWIEYEMRHLPGSTAEREAAEPIARELVRDGDLRQALCGLATPDLDGDDVYRYAAQTICRAALAAVRARPVDLARRDLVDYIRLQRSLFEEDDE